MDTGNDALGNAEDATASFGDTEGTDQFTGVAIKGDIIIKLKISKWMDVFLLCYFLKNSFF